MRGQIYLESYAASMTTKIVNRNQFSVHHCNVDDAHHHMTTPPCSIQRVSNKQYAGTVEKVKPMHSAGLKTGQSAYTAGFSANGFLQLFCRSSLEPSPRELGVEVFICSIQIRSLVHILLSKNKFLVLHAGDHSICCCS